MFKFSESLGIVKICHPMGMAAANDEETQRQGLVRH
jgi:hypothetical protein